MSYALSAALQSAVFSVLSNDASLSSIVGSAIFDALPGGTLPELYVLLGAETVQDASDASGAGAIHKFTISVRTSNPGFADAKDAAAAICDALLGVDIPLARGRLVSLGFDRASAQRISGGTARQIDLRFRARLEDDS